MLRCHTVCCCGYMVHERTLLCCGHTCNPQTGACGTLASPRGAAYAVTIIKITFLAALNEALL